MPIVPAPRDFRARAPEGGAPLRATIAGMHTIVVNGESRPLPAPATVAGLLDELGLAGRRIAVERNGEIVPRSRHDSETLAPGDRLEIVVAVGGG